LTNKPPVSAATLEADFDDIFRQIAEAAKRQEYMRLMSLQDTRKAFITAAPSGVSLELDLWKKDQDVILRANDLTKKTDYSQAIGLLQGQWQQRHTASKLDGDIGIALVRIAIGQQSMEDHWGLDKPVLRDVLTEVQAKDPVHVEALVLLAYMADPDPQEELLRLDSRTTMQQRKNTPLLTLSSAFENSGTSSELGREILAASKSLLGTARETAGQEFKFWTTMLTQPTGELYDAQMRQYTVCGGCLWRKGTTDDSFGWELMTPKPSGALWECWKITIVVSSPQAQTEIAKRLANTGPIATLPPLNGQTLNVYSSRQVSPSELLQFKIPLYKIPLDYINKGFQRSTGLQRKEQEGHRLVLTKDEVNKLVLIAGNRMEPQFSDMDVPDPEHLLYNLDNTPIIAILEPLPESTIALWNDKYFRLKQLDPSWPDKAYLREDGKLTIPTYGNGVILLPLGHVRYDTALVQAEETRRILNAFAPTLPSDNPYSILITLVKSVGKRGSKSVSDLVQDAIISDVPIFDVLDEMALKNQFTYSDTVTREYTSPPVFHPTRFENAKYLLQDKFNTYVQQARQMVATIPHGVDPRKNLVLCLGIDKDLLFLDEQGIVKNPFYGKSDCDKLLLDSWNDFFLKSLKIVPVPEAACQTTQLSLHNSGGQSPFTNDLLEKAHQYEDAGDYHLAAMLYRESNLPVFAFTPFDGTKPPNHDQVETIQHSAIKSISAGRLRLQGRLSHAQALNKAGRKEMAAELLLTAKSEWELSALPFLHSLQTFSQSYGYPVSGDFGEQYNDIQDILNGISAIQPAAALTIVRNIPVDNVLDKSLETWSPVVVNGSTLDRILPSHLSSMKPQDLDADWIHVYSSHDKPRNIYAVRHLLLSISSREMDKASHSDIKSLEWIASTYNSMGAFCLAVSTDEFIYGPARFDPNIVESLGLELDCFLLPRMRASSMSGPNIDHLEKALKDMKGMASNVKLFNTYALNRYPWYEYSAWAPANAP
jgi:hypothetical protein